MAEPFGVRSRVVIGALVGPVAALSVPAATWSQKLSEGIPLLFGFRTN
jgi:hypothetical protein